MLLNSGQFVSQCNNIQTILNFNPIHGKSFEKQETRPKLFLTRIFDVGGLWNASAILSNQSEVHRLPKNVSIHLSGPQLSNTVTWPSLTNARLHSFALTRTRPARVRQFAQGHWTMSYRCKPTLDSSGGAFASASDACHSDSCFDHLRVITTCNVKAIL